MAAGVKVGDHYGTDNPGNRVVEVVNAVAIGQRITMKSGATRWVSLDLLVNEDPTIAGYVEALIERMNVVTTPVERLSQPALRAEDV